MHLALDIGKIAPSSVSGCVCLHLEIFSGIYLWSGCKRLCLPTSAEEKDYGKVRREQRELLVFKGRKVATFFWRNCV
jgi:hypothetical protein